jgi:xylulose-5-phosphate/fructose-6-phosphate phosphoketolase
MHEDNLNFDKYLRAANYLTVAQIFLQDNFLLERPLTFDDVKPRLLGHWGSGPGVNLAYMHLSHLIQKYGQEMMFVLGPGHAFPALQANLFLEGTLGNCYPSAQPTSEGIGFICKNFSWPYGFPSHSNPGTPGVILEGGELGYSLATAYGAVLDNPDLIVACLVGDGEAETGTAATSWHLNKLVNPKTNGVVLPILHLNGYKISAPTIFGRMSDEELLALFSGYGYQPRIVDGTHPEHIHKHMADTLDWAYHTIQNIKNSHYHVAPKLPMIIMRTLKGWTGPKELNGAKIEGNALSHQVVLTEAKNDPEQLKMLEDWLKSYKFGELFDPQTGFGDVVEAIMPPFYQRMGASRHALGGEPVYTPLKLPALETYAEAVSHPGVMGSSSMIRSGLYLNEVFTLNEPARNFRFFSPDETYSNKLDGIFKSTARAWVWPIKSWDKDLSPDGRAMEMLSEQALQGLAQGYVLTGRHSVFASYEAFIMIVASMVDQYAKFLHHMRKIDWRGPIGSITYILTSSAWRQDHNGFSHQNPGFIDDVLHREGDFVNVYFPPDGNATLAVLEKCLSEQAMINVIVAAKTQEPRWLTPLQARDTLRSGVAVWDFASDSNPQIVVAAAGDYLTKEAVAAIDLAKTEKPDLSVRFVNIISLSPTGLGAAENKLSQEEFDSIFTTKQPVICNFHGYPETLKSIIYDYTNSPKRFIIHGYTENGSTTTPFDMHVRNHTSRYDLVIDIFEQLKNMNLVAPEAADALITKYRNKIDENTNYIKQHGVDLQEIDKWQWTR